MTETDPGLLPALLGLLEPDERGDPMSPLRWTTRSTRALARELTARGHRVSADTVGDLLRGQGFSLQGNAKTIEGAQSPDRDAQFRYVNEQVKAHQEAGQPVVSVDTKKKEQIGNFAQPGRRWEPTGRPTPVRDHDFVDAELGKIAPYGIYDLAANTGWVNVGVDHDTAVFAVESPRRWWRGAGAQTYPDATQLLVTADAGGSNSYRSRVWKAELATLAAETGLSITVCHFPPGTSKWNKIEHRLFSHITHNWRARPLTSHDVVINTIAATTTRTGLRIHAELDTASYPTGVKISDEQMAALALTRHDWHGDWNYTLDPHPPAPTQTSHQPTAPTRSPRRDSTGWTHPALTGIPTAEFDQLTNQLSIPYQAHREARLHIARGGPCWRKPAGGHPPTLTLREKILTTVLRTRFALPQRVLAELFGVATTTISHAEHDIRPLLDHCNHTIEPATRFKTLAELTTHAAAHGITLTPKIKPAC